MLAAVSSGSKPFFGVLLGLSTERMGLDSAYQLTADRRIVEAGGWVAFALLLIAIYGGCRACLGASLDAGRAAPHLLCNKLSLGRTGRVAGGLVTRATRRYPAAGGRDTAR